MGGLAAEASDVTQEELQHSAASHPSSVASLTSFRDRSPIRSLNSVSDQSATAVVLSLPSFQALYIVQLPETKLPDSALHNVWMAHLIKTLLKHVAAPESLSTVQECFLSQLRETYHGLKGQMSK